MLQTKKQTLKYVTKFISSYSYLFIEYLNFLRYDIYQDDEFKGTVQTTTSATFISLDSDTTYKFSIRAIYDVDGIEAGAFDTDLFETTL